MSRSVKNKEVSPAEVNTDPSSDELSRSLIAEDLDNNILVEAVPGSGKTYNLIKRLVAMVLKGRIPAGKIAAITFTRKAAEELRSRFHEELARLIDDKNTSADDKKLLQKAAVEIEDGYIGTIHGFCGAIIRQYPVEAGIDPGFREIEPDESREMLMNSWSRYLDEQPGMIDLLNAYNVGHRDDKLLRSLDEIAGHLDVEFPAPECLMPELAPILDAWDSTYEQALQYKPFADTENDLWPFPTELEFWRKLDRKDRDLKAARQTGNIYKAWYALSFKPAIFKTDESSSENGRSELVALIKSFYELFAEFSRKFCAAGYKELLNHCRAAVVEAAEERIRLGLLDFVDLLTRTAKLLKSNSAIRRTIAARYPYLLVDEFQDTDPVQAEIILLLTDPAGSNEWRKCSPRPGSLFVVGDPKQAIYRFRRGDIDTYRAVREILEKNGARVLTLQTNRRSIRQICEWVDNSFAPVFSKQKAAGQINFAKMHHHREGEWTDSIYRIDHQVEDLRSSTVGNHGNSLKIARLIKEATTAGRPEICGGKVLAPHDFLIVARRNDVLSEIVMALENEGIPTSLSGGGYFLADNIRQELLPLYWLLRAVALPSDSALLYAVLTGPFYGFSEEELYLYVRRHERLSVFNENDDSVVSKALQQIGNFNEWQREYSAGTAFRRIINEVSFYSWLQTRSEGEFKIKLMSDVEKMFDNNTFYKATETLAEWATAWPSDNRPAEPGTVSLMTVYRAKGLEAPVVICAGIPNKATANDPYICVTRDTDLPQGHMMFACNNGKSPYPKIFSCSPEYTGLANLEKTALTLEEMRKDYVAVTRARDCLIICTMSKEKNGDVKSALRSELKESIEVLPVLKIIDEQPTEAVLNDSAVKTDYQKLYSDFTAGLQQWRQKSSVASCEHSSVTALVEPADKSLFAKGSDGGMAYGSALHRVLELAMRNGIDKTSLESLTKLVEYVVSDDSEIKNSHPELVKEARVAVEHPVWLEACNAEVCYTEMPLAALETDIKGYNRTPDSLPVRLNGTIDLIYKNSAGWKIVDYKTDRINDDRHLQQLADWHSSQLKIYSHLWEKLTGEKVVEKTLLFVNYNRAVTV